MTAPTGLRYHVQLQDGKEVHRARMVAIEDKYGTKGWRCVGCPFERPRFSDQLVRFRAVPRLASTNVEAPPQSRW